MQRFDDSNHLTYKTHIEMNAHIVIAGYKRKEMWAWKDWQSEQ